MRVAHFIQRYPPALGGSEAYFARLGRHLSKQGDDVTVFTSDAIELEAFWSGGKLRATSGVADEEGIAVHRFPLWRWPGRRYCLKMLSLFPQRLWQCMTLPCNPVSPAMWRAAGRTDRAFDVVHATAFPYAWPIACARRLARRLRIPFLLTPFLHLGDREDPRDRTRRSYTSRALGWLLREADAVFVQSSAEREAARALGVDGAKVILQGLGVEPRECTGGERRATRLTWGIHPDEIVIGHLANNSAEKGTTDLLEAAAALWQRGVAARIVLAGPEMSNFKTFWKAFCARYPPKAVARVARLGVLSEGQKRDFFAAIDIFALPSRSDSFGLVLLEAWANGLPNVGYRAGGIAEVIRHEQDGMLVPCGSIAQLATALERLGTDPAERRRLGQAGQQRLEYDFRWQDKLDLVRQWYVKLAKGEG